MKGTEQAGIKGGPLILLGVLAIGWIGARAALWESPFTATALDLPGVGDLIAKNEPSPDRQSTAPTPRQGTPAGQTEVFADWSQAAFGDPFARRYDRSLRSGGRPETGLGSSTTLRAASYRGQIRMAASHQTLWMSAISYRPDPRTQGSAFVSQSTPPFTARPLASTLATTSPGRFSVDAWAFWRDGSNASAVSQGRVPIYGASQVGASAQFRLSPRSRTDPRLYLRGYRALVSRGETEVALGASIRPLAQVPVRAQAELRYTDGPFFNETRAAGFVVTELPPLKLPRGLVAEAYGQAGYVTGSAETAFADGQVTIMKEVASFDLASAKPARLSVGAGAWGGAQQDATRVDLGPTVRFDLTIGEVPARVSVDWREQVAGDAAPGSGVAATLSTRF